MSKKNRGFTLIELLVVISIIGLLSSIVMSSLMSARVKARDAKRIADFQQLRTALELFHTSYGFYPITAGAPTWDGHWQNLATCLETGVGCWGGLGGLQAGEVVPNFTPVMSKVPQDPQDSPSTISDSDPTYYYGYPSACGDGNSYRLGVYLERPNNILNSDLDGSIYNGGGECQDTVNGYCVGVGSCSGW